MPDTTHTPEVLWAQRSSDSDPEKNYIYLTIVVPDVSKDNLKLDIKDQSLSFSGRSDTLKRNYHLDLELYAPIDKDKSKILHTGMKIEAKLQKKELAEEFWPRLTKDKAKVHYLKTDFDRWVDEDEQEEAAEEDFSKFGDMGGIPGMGGDFGNLDFSKLGGGEGFPGGAEGAEEEDEDDDDMPALEGEEEEEGKAKAEPAKSS